MSVYPPPISNQSIFNPENFISLDDNLSIKDANNTYLIKIGDDSDFGSITMRNKPLFLSTGSVTSPSLSWNAEKNSGLYRFNPSDIRVSVGGSDKFSYGSSTNSSLQVLHLPNGSSTNPSLAFQSEQNTGMYRVGANDWGFTVGGTVRMRLSTATITTSLLYLTTNVGSVTNPSIQIGSTNYGLYQTGTTLSVSVLGSQIASFESGGFKLYNAVTNYSPSNLNYYEETSVSVTFNFGTNTANGTLWLTRVGRMVTASLQSDVVQTPSTSISSITTGLQIPSRFLPSSRKIFGTYIIEPAGSGKILYFAQINTDGSMAFSHPQNVLSGGVAITLYAFTGSWSVTL